MSESMFREDMQWGNVDEILFRKLSTQREKSINSFTLRAMNYIYGKFEEAAKCKIFQASRSVTKVPRKFPSRLSDETRLLYVCTYVRIPWCSLAYLSGQKRRNSAAATPRIAKF